MEPTDTAAAIYATDPELFERIAETVPAEPPAPVDKHGFPIRQCTRCHGSGRYSYNQIHGDMCYGCGGTGWQHTPKAAKQFAAWQTAIKAVARLSASQLTVGMEVRGWGNRTPFETVETIELTDEPCGWQGSGDNKVVTAHFAILNGRKINGATVFQVKGAAATVDRAPFVAAAR